MEGKNSHERARRWAPEFNAVGVKGRCLNRLTGAIDERICIPIIVILISPPPFPLSLSFIPNS